MPDRILLVEDDPNDVELLLHALAARNLTNEIHVVRDGEEALDYLRCQGTYRDRALVPPALVILDLKLPKIDGFEVLAAIRSDPSLTQLRVIVFTSSKEEMDVMRSKKLGADAYVVKTPGCADLVTSISLLAQQRRNLKDKSRPASLH
jgi:DNA-binding response OmpR family regulator